jgi:putative membrane protein
MMSIGMMLNMLFWIIIIGFTIYGIILLIMKPFENKLKHALNILAKRTICPWRN